MDGMREFDISAATDAETAVSCHWTRDGRVLASAKDRAGAAGSFRKNVAKTLIYREEGNVVQVRVKLQRH
jgi:hypothetical protein